MRNTLSTIKQYKRHLLLLLVVFVLLLLIIQRPQFRAALVIGIFIAVNTVITKYKKFVNFPIEIEILTLGIVLVTVAFGVKSGMILAILGGLASFFVGMDISPYAFPMFAGYLVMAWVAFFLSNISITWVGIITSLANNALVFLLYHFMFRYDPLKNMRFGLSNIILNIILFYNIAPFAFRLITAG